MKTRIFALLLAGAMTLALVSCGDQSPSSAQNSAAEGMKILGQESEKGEKYTLYLGLNDKDTFEQKISTEDAIEKANKICAAHSGGYTLFTANGLLVSAARATVGGVAETPYETVALAYQDWLCTQEMRETDRDRLSSDGRRHLCWLLDVPQLYSRRAPGNTCLSALYQQREGAAPGSTAHPLNTSKGCGGVMRVAPMGLLRFPGMDIRAADREGAELAALTHGHSLGYMPAAVLTHIIRRIVFPERALMLREIVREARDTAAELFAADPYIGRLTALLDLAVDLSGNGADDLENIHALGEGWVGEEALAIAVYCALRYQNDFSAGVIAAVNHRGDSDSTGAIAGNILGAWVGFDGIDVRWTDELELYDVILEIADDLCRAGGGDGSIDWKRKYL